MNTPVFGNSISLRFYFVLQDALPQLIYENIFNDESIVGIWTLWAYAYYAGNQGRCILVLCVEGIFVRNILIFHRGFA